MASQYTRLPVPSGEEARHASNDEITVEYELGSIRHQERERYEPFGSQAPSPYTSPSAEDYSYAPYQSDAPETRSPFSSIAKPGSKDISAVSVHSLTSFGEKSAKPTHTKSALRNTLLSWAFEITAITVTLGALLAIIFVLHRENGKSLSSWTLPVTLNTVIAALSTLARSTLAFALSACMGQLKWNWLHVRADQIQAWERFDGASRGPWGATRLFIWLRARYRSWSLRMSRAYRFTDTGPR
jgi:hypothetical protein